MKKPISYGLFNQVEEFKLRPYQQEVTTSLDKYVAYHRTSRTKHAKGVIVAPTGSGKSLIIGKVAAKINSPVLVLQPSVELLKQNYAKFISFGGQGTIYSASANKKQASNITFATLGSIKNKPELFKRLGVKTLMIDECFAGSTFIHTANGPIRIGVLFKDYLYGKELPLALSYNETTKSYEYKIIEKVIYNGVKQTYQYDFYGCVNMKCTPNHEVLTNNGWNAIGSLVPGDLVRTFGGDSRTGYIKLNGDQESVFDGAALGDGNISYQGNGHTCRLRIIHGAGQKEYLEWKNSLLFNSKIQVVDNNGYSGKTAYRFSTKQVLYNKSIEQIISELNIKSLAILWMDDASVCKKDNSGRLHKFGRKKDLCNMLNDKINQLIGCDGILSSYNRGRKPMYYIRYKKKDLEKLTYVIAPYVYKSMAYKVVGKHRNLVGSYRWIVPEKIEKYSVLKGVSKYKETKVYDLTVSDNHNYVLCSPVQLHGPVVHNCHYKFPFREGSMFRRFVNKLEPTLSIGLTATPLRLVSSVDGARLNFITRMARDENYFNDMIHVIQIQSIADKYWPKLKYEAYDFNTSSLVLNSSGSEFTERSVKVALTQNNVNNNIYLNVKRLAPTRKNILVFVESVEVARILASRFDKAAWVSGTTPKKKRERIVEDFKHGDIQIVFNHSVFTTGFDHPDLDCVIMGRPTNSFALYYQVLGRICRTSPNKTNGLILDFGGNIQRFGYLHQISVENYEGWGWGVFSGGRVISNIPMGGSDLTKEMITASYHSKNKKKAALKLNADHNEYIYIHFGKHVGSTVESLPTDYLNYCVDKFDLSNSNIDMKLFIKKAKEVLFSRQKSIA